MGGHPKIPCLKKKPIRSKAQLQYELLDTTVVDSLNGWLAVSSFFQKLTSEAPITVKLAFREQRTVGCGALIVHGRWPKRRFQFCFPTELAGPYQPSKAPLVETGFIIEVCVQVSISW